MLLRGGRLLLRRRRVLRLRRVLRRLLRRLLRRRRCAVEAGERARGARVSEVAHSRHSRQPASTTRCATGAWPRARAHARRSAHAMAVPTQSPIAIERRSGCHGRETPRRRARDQAHVLAALRRPGAPSCPRPSCSRPSSATAEALALLALFHPSRALSPARYTRDAHASRGRLIAGGDEVRCGFVTASTRTCSLRRAGFRSCRPRCSWPSRLRRRARQGAQRGRGREHAHALEHAHVLNTPRMAMAVPTSLLVVIKRRSRCRGPRARHPAPRHRASSE